MGLLQATLKTRIVFGSMRGGELEQLGPVSRIIEVARGPKCSHNRGQFGVVVVDWSRQG